MQLRFSVPPSGMGDIFGGTGCPMGSEMTTESTGVMAFNSAVRVVDWALRKSTRHVYRPASLDCSLTDEREWTLNITHCHCKYIKFLFTRLVKLNE